MTKCPGCGMENDLDARHEDDCPWDEAFNNAVVKQKMFFDEASRWADLHWKAFVGSEPVLHPDPQARIYDLSRKVRTPEEEAELRSLISQHGRPKYLGHIMKKRQMQSWVGQNCLFATATYTDRSNESMYKASLENAQRRIADALEHLEFSNKQGDPHLMTWDLHKAIESINEALHFASAWRAEKKPGHAPTSQNIQPGMPK